MGEIWSFVIDQMKQPDGLRNALMWASALLCFVFSYFCARRVSKDPSLFTVLALFAVSWVLVMAAIDARLAVPTVTRITAVADRAFDVTSLLWVFAGATLAREDSSRRWLQRSQRWVQVGALWVFFLMVLPSQLPMKLPLTPAQTELALGEVLGDLGFLSLILGTLAVAGQRLFWSMVIIVTCYASVGAVRTWDLFLVPDNIPRPFMGPQYVYSFIAMRFLLTGLFCHIVTQHFKKKWAGVRVNREQGSRFSHKPAF